MATPQLPSKITFHYIKSHLFRVIHAEGAIGGLTPSREIFFSLFNERGALPQSIEYSISPDGKLGEESRREGKTGIVRETEIGILITAENAKKLSDFLLEQIKLIQESQPETAKENLSGGMTP
jgi:hypothetical protein